VYFRKSRYPEAIAALEKACDAERPTSLICRNSAAPISELLISYFDPSLAIQGQNNIMTTTTVAYFFGKRSRTKQ
jgi:hypothetical protein